MIETTRRHLLGGSALALAGAALPGAAAAAAPPATAPDLFVGTGGHGHVFPGASLPFGMVQLSPDTDNTGWDWCSGYHHGDASIMGFSHTHLSGTGIGDMLDVLVVPTRQALMLEPGPVDAPDRGYRQRYTGERAEPGYYRVALESGVDAELTVTERCGLHRYRFADGPGHILIDFAHAIDDKWDAGQKVPVVEDASLAIDADGTITGGRTVNRWAKGRRIHFAMQLSRRPDRIQFFRDDRPQSAAAASVRGDRLKLALFFDQAGGAPILVRTGLSAVDEPGARLALASEAKRWDFDHAAADARRRWSDLLDRVRVAGGTPAQRTIMASAMYHACLGPTLFSDADGRYRGFDGQVHADRADSPSYSAYSTWDTYRALHPLLTLIAPDQAALFAEDLCRQTAQSPYGPPVWPLQGVETGTMIGWHSATILAEAQAKGIRADYAAAWLKLRARAFDRAFADTSALRGRGYYQDLGYVPADKVDEAVSRTQEYCQDDWATAHLAKALGHDADATALTARSRNWRNVIDPAIGFARPRFADGTWWRAYDPVQLGHDTANWRDYTEANGWQATFLNQHDVHGLIAHFGGDRAFERKLDALFTAPSTLPKDAPPDISGLIGQYAHGNEPGHHVAYLYAYCGAPAKTQAMVRRLLTEMYKDDPDGIIGNDDCGQMSAWFILSALGFYPVEPVSAIYVLGSPLFDQAEVRVGDNRRLHVRAIGNAADRPYVQAVRWNGRPWTRNWIAHGDLVKGGELTFEMGAAPSSFGTAIADRPPSFGHGAG